MERYKETRVMPNVIGVNLRDALNDLPSDEKDGGNNGDWPYY